MFGSRAGLDAEATTGANGWYDARKALFDNDRTGDGAVFDAGGASGALIGEAVATSDDGDVRVIGDRTIGRMRGWFVRCFFCWRLGLNSRGGAAQGLKQLAEHFPTSQAAWIGGRRHDAESGELAAVRKR